MACLNMYDQQQQGHCSSIPRISFSSDFSDPKHLLPNRETINYREPPVSSDFEFSVPGRAMINAADELIFKGKLMPVRENSTKIMTTLKDELLVDDDDDEFEDVLPRLSKGSGWWGERWALKRAHNLTKKGPKNNDNIFALKP